MKKFAQLFNKNYSAFYDNYIENAETEISFNTTFGVLFDLDGNFKEKVLRFVKYRGDFLSSDHERAAFVAAYYGKTI